jgi:hypothetical protein
VIDLDAGFARLVLDRALYDGGALDAAALAVGAAARVRVKATETAYVVELRAAARGARPAELASRYAAEALMQAYRRRVLEASGDAPARALAAALAGGLTAAPLDPLEQLEPQVGADRVAETERQLEEARGTPRRA